MLKKELVIICDTPSQAHDYIKNNYSCIYYQKYFDVVRILYWAKEKMPEIIIESDKLVFYPHSKPYNSGFITGILYMAWIAGTLWRICKKTPKNVELVFMPVIPIWAGLPSLIISKIKRKKNILRIGAKKIEYLMLEEKLANRPRILTLIKALMLEAIYYLTLPFYDLVIGISPEIEKEAKSYGAKKTITIPVPLDLEPFLKIREGETENKIPVILYVGQIKKTKGIHDLIEAAKILKKETSSSFKLSMVGSATNPKDKNFYEEIQEAGRGLNIEFLGWVSHQELPKIYEKADIFVLPSYSEALGGVIAEAMTSGLPVIATKTSGAKYLVEDDKTGFLVPIGEPKIIKEKIKILIENSALRKSMGEAGKERVKKIMEEADEKNKKLSLLLRRKL